MNAHEAETLTKIAALRDAAAVLDAKAQALTAEATRCFLEAENLKAQARRLSIALNAAVSEEIA